MIKYIIALIIIFFAMQEPAMAEDNYKVWLDYNVMEILYSDGEPYCEVTPAHQNIYNQSVAPGNYTAEENGSEEVDCGNGTVSIFYETKILLDGTFWGYSGSYGVPTTIRFQNTSDGPGSCEENQPLPIEPNSWEGEEISFDSLKNKFASKFPLDMVFLSSQNGGGNEDCPVFNLLGRSMPACIIIMLIKSAKWPILISIIIRTIFSI